MTIIRILKYLIFSLLTQTGNAQSFSGFNADIENYAQLLKLPTLAVGVAKGDSLIFFKGIGSASSETQVPITSDHIFTIASVTKTFTSVVLQQLEAEGKISLHDLIDKYPNKFFNTNRWDKTTTLEHIIGHTSESNPIGTNFIYNGSKFNLVFNLFFNLNPPVDTESITRPFTKEIEQRILRPLNMNYTLVRYTETEYSQLKKFIVTPYDFNDSSKKYLANPVNLPNIESGPAYGMMSSVNDLIKYSQGLQNQKILPAERYQRITSPFYPGSPQGLGWFSYNFEGIDIDWAYGYGTNDAAIFLKVPLKDLTLILLSSCTMPSATATLGYGNPLNSPVVSSFIKNFILNQPEPNHLNSGAKNFQENTLINKVQNKSRINIEEAFAKAAVILLSPISTLTDKQKGNQLLKQLIKKYPNDVIWQSTSAIDLMASIDDKFILRFASKKAANFYQVANLHPAKMFFSGVIEEKLGRKQNAIQLFQKLTDGDTYREQVYKFNALMKLAKYFQKTNPKLSKSYLGKLINYKEYIGVQDDQYKEAKNIYSKL